MKTYCTGEMTEIKPRKDHGHGPDYPANTAEITTCSKKDEGPVQSQDKRNTGSVSSVLACRRVGYGILLGNLGRSLISK